MYGSLRRPLVAMLSLVCFSLPAQAAPPRATGKAGEPAQLQQARAQCDAHQAEFESLRLASRTAQFKLEVARRNPTLPAERVDALSVGARRAHESVVATSAALQREVQELLALERVLGLPVDQARQREAESKLAKLAEVQRAVKQALDELPEFAESPARAELPKPAELPLAAPPPPAAPLRFEPKGPKVGVQQCDLRKVDWPNAKLTIGQVLRFEQGTAPRKGSTRVLFLSATLDAVAYLDSNQDGRDEALLDLTFVDHFYDEEEDQTTELFKGFLLEADSQCQVHLVAKLWDGSSASRTDAKPVAGGFDVLRHAQGATTQLRDEWRWKAGALSVARSVAARSASGQR